MAMLDNQRVYIYINQLFQPWGFNFHKHGPLSMGFIKQEPWYLSDLRPWPEWGADAWRHQALRGQRWELWDSEAAEVPHLVGGLEHLLFFHIYGISSSQLTNMFQRVETTNQSCFFPHETLEPPWCKNFGHLLRYFVNDDLAANRFWSSSSLCENAI